jgi:integrase
MGTITTRRRQDGSAAYTAQIRLKREGKLVHSEAETFSSRRLATEWITRREAELNTQRARGEPVGQRMTVEQMVEWYEARERPDARWGRTKRSDLARIRSGPLAGKRVDRLTRPDFIAYIERRRGDGAGPATAGNDLIWLRQVFRAAQAVLGTPVPLHALDEAAEYLRQHRLIGKPRRRTRRLTADEERVVLEHFERRDRRAEIPMVPIIRFALLTARRQDEITRLRWADLDRATGTALLRDVKHPTQKIGNDKRFRMLEAAWAIVEAQPRVPSNPLDPRSPPDPRVFPFNAKSIGTAFTNAMHLLGIHDLHFHDLRHEATSRLFERGYSIQEVAQFTLHESWATLKRYTHLRPEDVPER